MPGKKQTNAGRKNRIPRILGIPVWHYQHLHLMGLALGLVAGYLVSLKLDPNIGRPFMETPERYVPIILGAGAGFMVGELTRRIVYHRYYDDRGRLRGIQTDDD